MLRLIGVELFKLKKRWLLYMLLIALLAFSIIPIIADYSSYNTILKNNPGIEDIDITEIPSGGDGVIFGEMPTPLQRTAIRAASLKESFTLPGSIEGVFSTIAGLGPILVIILAASAIGSEYRWGTLRQMLVKGTGRAGYLGSKLIGIAIAIIAGIIIALLSVFITSLITTWLATGGISWDFLSLDFIGHLFSSLGRILLILGVYFTLAALFTVWLRSVTAGMIIGIIFISAESIIIALLSGSSGWLADIVPYTIGHNIQELTGSYIFGIPDYANTKDLFAWLKPVAILLTYCTALLAAGFYAFRRQDITA
ncbi:MAG: ABC transporter permease [Dehalococcoidales bacterium]|nr:ABC transporter permease [Dehalococcoidales bacterium]